MSADSLIYGAVTRGDLEKVSRAMITRNRAFVKKGRLSRAKTGSTTALKCDNYFTIELFQDSTGETRFTFEPLDPDDHLYDDLEVETVKGKIDIKKCFNLGFFSTDSDEDEDDEPTPKPSTKSVKSVKSEVKKSVKKSKVEVKKDEAYAEIDSDFEPEVELEKKTKKRRSDDDE